MAKNNKGGLGRGIGSLMGNQNDTGFSAPPQPQRTTNRDRIVYDEREDVVYENNEKKAVDERVAIKSEEDKTKGNKVEDVSRETSNVIEEKDESTSNASRIAGLSSTGSFMPVNSDVPVKPLIDDSNEDDKDIDSEDSAFIQEVAIDRVVANPDQPRKNFKEEDLKELSNSIKREGLIQPILVRKIDDTYQIIAGERRWQASKLAGLATVPVQIKDVDDQKALELALIENIQRSDLNPIEEAYAYKQLMDKNQMTQADIAQAVSKGRSTIANALRLLDLPEDAQKLLFDGEISAGHARAILSVPTKEGRAKLTEKLMDKKMSVREVESLARLMANKPTDKPKKAPTPPVYKSVVRSLKASLDTDVKIKTAGGKNKIEISFTDESDLERIFDLLSPE